MRTRSLALPVVLGLLLQPLASTAATFCVDTAAELQAALQTAAGNGQDDTIRVKTGFYGATSGGVAFIYTTSESFDLLIEGGWVTFAMLDCGRQAPDPTTTVLSGSSVRQVLAVSGGSGTDGAITLEGFTVLNGLAAESGGGLRAGGVGGYAGDITIDRMLFRNNVATMFGGGLSGGTNGIFVLRNSLFLGNGAGSDHGAASLTVNSASTTNYRAFIGNNTIVNNDCAVGCSTGGIRVGGSARQVVFNNAFAFNAGNDVVLNSVITDVFNNNIVTLQGTPAASSGNLALSNPLFVNAPSNDYRLQTASPLRNAGTGGFVVGGFDFAGVPRLNDGQYDIGAFENDDVLLRDGFENIF